MPAAGKPAQLVKATPDGMEPAGIPQMPLADDPGDIARLPRHRGQQPDPGREAVAAPELDVADAAEALLVEPARQAGPRRAADGRRDAAPRELNPGSHRALDVRRPEVRQPLVADIPVARVVDEDDDDVRTTPPGGSGAGPFDGRRRSEHGLVRRAGRGARAGVDCNDVPGPVPEARDRKPGSRHDPVPGRRAGAGFAPVHQGAVRCRPGRVPRGRDGCAPRDQPKARRRRRGRGLEGTLRQRSRRDAHDDEEGALHAAAGTAAAGLPACVRPRTGFPSWPALVQLRWQKPAEPVKIGYEIMRYHFSMTCPHR